jgi:hypothetical protein
MTDKSRGEILLYKAEDGNAKLEVRLEQETIWLDAHQMGALFERDRSVIVKHIRNIYRTGELSPDSTCAKNAQVAADRKIRMMDLYNLDMVISVGYRVKSKRGTLMIAESRPEEKDVMVRVIMNLINRRN